MTKILNPLHVVAQNIDRHNYILYMSCGQM